VGEKAYCIKCGKAMKYQGSYEESAKAETTHELNEHKAREQLLTYHKDATNESAKPYKLDSIPEAQEVIIMILESGNIKNFMKIDGLPLSHVDDNKKSLLVESISRRTKYEYLLYRVVAEGHRGILPKEVIWDRKELAWDSEYAVIETLPKGIEVQITEKTKIICLLKDLFEQYH
jgi:hypothetical protein